MENVTFVFVLGLVVGSFIGMLTFRLPRGLSILGRSFCDSCKKQISSGNNIPVLSYFLLKGKSSCCGKKVSIRYPIIEISTAIIFAITFLIFSGEIKLTPELGFPYLWWITTFKSFSLWIFLIIVSCFIALTVIDIEFTLLPDTLLKVLSLPILIFLLLSPPPVLFDGLLWGFIAFGFFLTIYLVTREKGMGFGDIKMSFLLGALLGFPGVLSWLLISFLSGSIIGIFMLFLKKAKIGKPIPFGPFLLVSAYISFFWGSELYIWYTLKLVQGF